MKTNPLTQLSKLQHHAIPFQDVTVEDFLPAIEQAISRAQNELTRILNDPEPPNFANTIERLETLGEALDLASSTFFNLLGTENNERMEQLAQEIGPKVAAFSNDLLLNDKLFARVEAVVKAKPQLNGEQKRLLEETYKNFTQNGAGLPAEKKNRLREIDQELARRTPEFSNNLLKATNAFALYLTDPKELSGLPKTAVEAAAAAATAKGKDGQWLFTLQAPSLIPFLKFADRRDLREKMWRAFQSRAFKGEFDNSPVALRIAKLRHERAQLLGFKTHAQFVLSRRMAETPERVHSFLKKILDVCLPAARKELEEVKAFAKTLGFAGELMPWDLSYYSEKLKEHKFQFKEEELRPYFQLDNVVKGVFEHARRLYGLRFKPSSEYPTFNPEVKVFEVEKESSGDFIGLLYMDFFPRESKNGGAWMTQFLGQGLFAGEVQRPHVLIECNFTKPTPSTPALLDLTEVRTLFHEFGHALHGLLSQCHYRSLSGTNVYWDFVELPSQIMENWVRELESLNLYARHYQTGESIPKELVAKVQESGRFQAGMMNLRQINFARLDMAWHDQDPSAIHDIEAFEEKVTKESSLLPRIPGTLNSTSFGHIFAGGYSAGYYSYKWAEVLDADAFSLFKEKGIFSSEVAKKFEDNILARGGSENPMDLYRRFRGRDPDPDALLRRDGLI